MPNDGESSQADPHDIVSRRRQHLHLLKLLVEVFVGTGAILATIVYGRELITPSLTLWGSITVVITWVFLEVIVPRKGIWGWTHSGTPARFRRMHIPRVVLLGLLAALISPRFFPKPSLELRSDNTGRLLPHATNEAFERQLKTTAEAKRDTAAAYFYSAEFRFAAGSLREAIAMYDLSLHVLPTSAAYLNRATAFYALSEYDDAESSLIAGLKLSRETGTHAVEADILNMMSAIYLVRGDPSSALRTAEDGLALAREERAPLSEAYARSNIGEILAQQGNYDAAEESEKIALELFRAKHHHHGEARAVTLLAGIYVDRTDLRMALHYYNLALELSRESADTLALAIAFNNLGNVYADSGQYEIARTQYNAGYDLARTTGNRLVEARSLNNLGALLNDQQHGTEARAVLRESFQLYDQIGNPEGAGDVSINLGTSFYLSQAIDSALVWFQRAQSQYSRAGISIGVAKANGNRGEMHRIRGDFPRARLLIDSALRTFRQLGNLQGEATSLGALGNVLTEEAFAKGVPRDSLLMRLDQASDYYRSCTAVARRAGLRRKETDCLFGLTNAFLEKGTRDSIVLYAAWTLRAARALPETLMMALASGYLGRFLDPKAECEKAKSALTESLALFEAIPAERKAPDISEEIKRIRKARSRAPSRCEPSHQ
jgi:tetratricopeptide (TPR) repeat protein